MLDENGWKVEAEAIIKDVGEFVEVIQVSDMLEVRRITNDNSLVSHMRLTFRVAHMPCLFLTKQNRSDI